MILLLCPICGEPFDPHPPTGPRRTCSRSCGQQLRGRPPAEPRPHHPKTGFVIMEGRRRYVPRVWESYDEARRELIVLLRPYPRDSVWRKKLEVRAC